MKPTESGTHPHLEIVNRPANQTDLDLKCMLTSALRPEVWRKIPKSHQIPVFDEANRQTSASIRCSLESQIHANLQINILKLFPELREKWRRGASVWPVIFLCQATSIAGGCKSLLTGTSAAVVVSSSSIHISKEPSHKDYIAQDITRLILTTNYCE